MYPHRYGTIISIKAMSARAVNFRTSAINIVTNNDLPSLEEQFNNIAACDHEIVVTAANLYDLIMIALTNENSEIALYIYNQLCQLDTDETDSISETIMSNYSEYKAMWVIHHVKMDVWEMYCHCKTLIEHNNTAGLTEIETLHRIYCVYFRDYQDNSVHLSLIEGKSDYFGQVFSLEFDRTCHGNGYYSWCRYNIAPHLSVQLSLLVGDRLEELTFHAN
jgi:hypothetical protein